MIRAIKAVSTERGRDPREFALFAFGGNGPLFAAGMAAALGIPRIVVPPSRRPVLVVRPALRRRRAPLLAHVPPPAAPGRSRARSTRPGTRCRARRARNSPSEGFTGARARLKRSAALHYQGQTYELTVPVPDGPIDATHGGASRGGVRRGARAHLRPSRRAGRAGRAGGDPGCRPGLREGGGVPRRVVVGRAGARAAGRRARPISARSTAGWRRRC